MTLEEQTKLIDDLIRENSDVTIKEFIELKCELEGIQNAPKAKVKKGPTVQEVIDERERMLLDQPKPIYKTRHDERKYYHRFSFRR